MTLMTLGMLLASESKVLMWKFEFPSAQHLDIRDRLNNWRHFPYWTQMFGIREMPLIGYSIFVQNRAVLLNAFLFLRKLEGVYWALC